MSEYICKRCNKEFDNYVSLRKHSSRVHKIKSSDFYVEFYLNGEHPTCKCGCGEQTTWFNGEFREYKKGHIARIHNNWGHNQKAINKSAETRRNQYANGEREPWCKGLTKETDKRIRNLAKKASNTINSNPDELKRRSNNMRKNRLNGTIPTLYGKSSSQWNGGSSSINMLIRNDKRLYENWIYPILKRDEFKCVDCNSTKQLEVHHNDKTMADIISEFVDKSKEYTFDEKKSIVSDVIQYHTLENVSGVTLCKNCHTKLHPSYNI
jgi:hypothetical protein